MKLLRLLANTQGPTPSPLDEAGEVKGRIRRIEIQLGSAAVGTVAVVTSSRWGRSYSNTFVCHAAGVLTGAAWVERDLGAMAGFALKLRLNEASQAAANLATARCTNEQHNANPSVQKTIA